MFTKLWQKITGHRRQHPHQSLRAAAREIGVPKSTIHDHDKRLEKRNLYTESVFWESSAGQNFLKRILVSSIPAHPQAGIRFLSKEAWELVGLKIFLNIYG